MNPTENKVSFAGFVFDGLAFIPHHFTAFVKNIWRPAAVLFAVSLGVFSFAETLSFELRCVLLLIYTVFSAGVYASTAVWVCRRCSGSLALNAEPAFGAVELHYTLRLLAFWTAYTILFFVMSVPVLLKSHAGTDITDTQLFISVASGFAMLFVLINMLPILTSVVMYENISPAAIWRSGKGYRLRIFCGSFALLILAAFLSGVPVILLPPAGSGIMAQIPALLSGMAVFFLDICSQTAYLASVSRFLHSIKN